jgi:aryl-alcohol dehydrogenase-like predicted oxidoreductase
MTGIGMTVIDTADSYGSGDCECLLGKVLRGRRESFTLVTKAGYRHSNLRGPLRPLNQFVKKGLQRLGYRQLFESGYLRNCLEQSLSRLGVGQIDAFLLHDPPLAVVNDDSVIRTCVDMSKSGKTTLTGISSGDPEVLKRALDSGAFGVIQTPANLKAAAVMRPLWLECESRGIHVIGNHVFDPACLDLAGMTHEKLMRGSSALLPVQSTILSGTRNPAHLRQANEWANNPLSKAEAEHLSELLNDASSHQPFAKP